MWLWKSPLRSSSTSTTAARATASVSIAWEFAAIAVELATQSDTGSNPDRVDADYHHVSVGVPVGPVRIEAGHEMLEGSTSGNGSFSTPLATLHAFNGWADKFLVTPTAGLEDAYIGVGGKVVDTKLKAVYHDYHAEANSRDYGWELDLLASTALDEDSAWGAKWADFHAEDFATDTQKFWLWYETKF